jgi:hypothetical protein
MSDRFSEVPYKLVKKILVEKLGFEVVEVPNRYYLFTHRASDTLFPLPILPNHQYLAMMNYRTLYHILDKRGIISEKAFQTLINNEISKQSSMPSQTIASTGSYQTAQG